MSSDSELEEFYDAVDGAISTAVVKSDSTTSSVSPSSGDRQWLCEIQREEDELRLLKQRAEERRQKEDHEFAERLSKIEKQKTEQSGRRGSAESPAETKMTKLQRLRQQMSDDRVFDPPDVEQHSSFHLDDRLAYISDASRTHDTPIQTETKTEAVLSSTDNVTHTSSSGSVNSSFTGRGWTEEDVHEIVREVCEAASRSNSLNRDSEPSYGHTNDIKDLSACVVSEIKKLSLSSYEEGSNDEPDIVKSTRVTPPQTLLPAPVAPPRRRRQAVQSAVSAEGTAAINVTLPPPMPVAPNQKSYRLSAPPITLRGSLSSEHEYSLDVDSALGGRRHIHADDIAVDSSNIQRPPSRVNSLERGILLRKASLEAAHNSIADYLYDVDCQSRPRSNSGRSLTDQEILESVMVLNLDTGEQVPLSHAEEKLPKCVNPLALHIMRRTKEYNSHSSLNKGVVSDDDYDTRSEGGRSISSIDSTAKWKADRLKRLINKSVSKSIKKVKRVAEESKKGIAEVLEGDDMEMENEVSVDGKKFKFKRSRGNKGPYSFAQFRILQDLNGHEGAVWTMKFSPCGRLLASGGQDTILRVWVLKSSFTYFDEMRVKSNDLNRLTPSHSEDSLDSVSSERVSSSGGPDGEEKRVTFTRKPFQIYRGHTADLLDIAWSKNNFILSSSMDKTVRLWHITRRECLCTFQHIDFVTAIVFHPRDDRYFLSGSLDGNLRLWNIPDKKVTLRNEVTGPSSLITTANFCDNGRFAVVGMYDGRCILYHTDKLKYYTQINVRSTRGKNRGRKITGVEPICLNNKNLMLITSNDSRIRLYDLRDLTLTCKFKGHINNSSQIKASFSGDGKSIISGSEDHFVYVWKTQHDYNKMSSARRDRNHYWEAIKVHNAVVTSAIFATRPELFIRTNNTSPVEKTDGTIETEKGATSQREFSHREIIISADFNGVIKIVQNSVLLS